jgi:hypothetical protein
LLTINVALVLFNLIPAFPMDGGRVFRAFLSWFTSRVTATEIASIVGAGFAILFGLYGLYVMNPFLVLIAVAVFLMGRGEVAYVRAREEQRRWAGRSIDDDIPIAYPVGSKRHFAEVPDDGWVWDPKTRMWTLWRGGYAVRRVRGE